MSVRIHRPQTLEELCLRLADGAQVLGGGTVLVPQWARTSAPASAVTLDRIALAQQLTPSYVGAAVSLEELAGSAVPAALREAARSIGTPHLRSQATVGGNVGSGRPGCLLTALVSLGARALVLYGTNGREANMSLEEARTTGAVILGLEWRCPDVSRYRKLRRGRAGLPEFAVAVAGRRHGHNRRLTAAVWRAGEVTAATTAGPGGRDAVSDDEARMARLAFQPELDRWEEAVLAAELRAVSGGHAPGLVLQGSQR